MLVSKLQQNPKSKILIPGYINIYSKLTDCEKRQHFFKTLYKQKYPEWEESQVFLSKEFKKYIKPNLHVLDAGCGHGNYVIDENRKNIHWAVGVDISKEAVTKNVCLDDIKIADLENMPFDANSFDIVLSLWVFEHLEHPDKVFKEVYRVLKPGGIFMFAAPNRKFLPLFLLNRFRLSKLIVFLNSVLFGMHKKDIFDAYYKANDVDTIKMLAGDLFEIEQLFLNYDPSYTAFSKLMFNIFNSCHKILSFGGFALSFPHIIGVLCVSKAKRPIGD